MSDNSLIEWCTATWNFLIGCTKKSAGCMNCYAIRQAWRLMHNPNPKIAAKFAGTVHKDSKGELNWTGRVNFDDELITKPLSWKLPRRIFVNSLSDLFHKNVKDEWIDQAFAVMALCPQHTFQILTKEPERMRDYAEELRNIETAVARFEHAASQLGLVEEAQCRISNSMYAVLGEGLNVGWPMRNVQLGTSVEDQKTFDDRWPYLRDTPAWTRWLSIEPLLGPIDARTALTEDHYYCDVSDHPDDPAPAHRCRPVADWIVVGGESGPKARPSHPDWFRSLRDQCEAASVPFFFKQWGEFQPGDRSDCGHDSSDGAQGPVSKLIPAKVDVWRCNICNRLHGYSDDQHFDFHRIGRKAAGRMLDGRTWDEFPKAVTV